MEAHLKRPPSKYRRPVLVRSDMSLEEHARRELKLCGQYDEDPEYSESIIRAVREFASYGHSGGSASVAREQLHTLLAFKTLSPITSDPGEWLDQSEASGVPMWQNRRDPTFFSTDGGETWYNLDDNEKGEIVGYKAFGTIYDPKDVTVIWAKPK
jgi:hypothetical protein